MRVITTYFRDTRTAKLTRTGSTEIVTLDRGTATTRIAWARGPITTTISLPAFASEGLLVNLDGSTQPITPLGRRYILTLPGAKCDDPNFGCRVGGHPLILVENNVTAKSVAAPIVASTATPRPKAK